MANPIGAVATDTLRNVFGNHTISVTFAINTYTLTPTVTGGAGGHGTITPSGVLTVPYDTSVTFTLAPSSGYHIDSLFVDSIRTDTASHYTLAHISRSHTIRVVFAINQYVITASADAHGVISPSGPVQINNGADQAFTFTPNLGYVFDSLLVDGATRRDSAAHYTFYNVTGGHSIAVYFKVDSVALKTYRTFTDSLLSWTPTGKLVALKSDKVEFTLAVRDSNTAPVTGLHLEFGSAIDTLLPFSIDSTVSSTYDSKVKIYNCTFSHPIVKNTWIGVKGFAWGKGQKTGEVLVHTRRSDGGSKGDYASQGLHRQ